LKNGPERGVSELLPKKLFFEIRFNKKIRDGYFVLNEKAILNLFSELKNIENSCRTITLKIEKWPKTHYTKLFKKYTFSHSKRPIRSESTIKVHHFDEGIMGKG
jgi:hypothetical protein